MLEAARDATAAKRTARTGASSRGPGGHGGRVVRGLRAAPEPRAAGAPRTGSALCHLLPPSNALRKRGLIGARPEGPPGGAGDTCPAETRAPDQALERPALLYVRLDLLGRCLLERSPGSSSPRLWVPPWTSVLDCTLQPPSFTCSRTGVQMPPGVSSAQGPLPCQSPSSGGRPGRTAWPYLP